MLQPHEVSPEYLKGKAAKNAVATIDKNKPTTSKEVKKKVPVVPLTDVAAKVSYFFPLDNYLLFVECNKPICQACF